MSDAFTARPVTGRASARRNLRLGTALGGPLALALVALPGAAMAQDECGTAPAGGGTVTCVGDDNPFATGIFYNPIEDLTVVLNPDVAVDTTGGGASGVLVLSGGPDVSARVQGLTGSSVTSDTDGILLNTTNSTIESGATINAGIRGLAAYADENATIVNDGAVTVDGTLSGANFSSAIVAGINDGTATIINNGTVSVTGADNFSNGIIAQSFGTDASIAVSNTGSIAVDSTGAGGYSNGIFVGGYAGGTGSATITNSGDITVTSVNNARGIATFAYGDGGVTIDNSGAIDVSGDSAHGILAYSDSGDVSITSTGDIVANSTTGGFAGGVRAIADDGNLTIDVADVTTTGDNTPGVYGRAYGDVVASTGNVSTDGDNSNGIDLASVDGSVTVNADGSAITTTGDNSAAINLTSTYGAVSVTADNIVTSGELSGGVRAFGGTDSDVSVDVNNVTTTGLSGSFPAPGFPSSSAVVAVAQGTGNVTVTTGDISTQGQNAVGVDARAADGSISVGTLAISTSGDGANGVTAQSYGGDVFVTTGTVSTTGTNSAGVYAVANDGAVAVQARDAITTSGFNARGINAISGEGGTDISFTSVEVGGDFSSGISAISNGGDVSVSGADILTTGTVNYALYASSDDGDVSVTTTGDVSSTGRGSTGIAAFSGTGDVTVNANNVSVIAADAGDTETTRGAIQASGANATVVVTGTVSTGGSALYGGSADAVNVAANDGDANVTVNNVTTTGDNADAVQVAATGTTTINANGAISTAGEYSRGIIATGDEGVTISGDAASVTTTGDYSSAVSAYSATGPVSVNIDNIITNGNYSNGVIAAGGVDSDVTIDVNNVTTTGAYGATAVIAQGAGLGNVSVTTGGVSTLGDGAQGVVAFSDEGTVSVTTGSVSALGDGTIGITAQSYGAVTVDAGDVTASDVGIGVRSGTSADVSFDSVTTTGNGPGVYAAAYGPVTVSGGDVTTSGDGATGVYAISTGDVSVTTTGTVSTSGISADGVYAYSDGGDTAVSVTDVSTTGDDSDAVEAVSVTGTTTVNANGAISTAGDYSFGILASGETGVTINGNNASVTTSGDYSNAVDVYSATGPVSVTLDNILTSGDFSNGVLATGGTDSDVTVDVNNVTTTGAYGATAVIAAAYGEGNVVVTTGAVSTLADGAIGVDASAEDGDVSVGTLGVTTFGDDAIGVSAESLGGNVSVSTGSVATLGDGSTGIYAVAEEGSVTVNARGTVSTTGDSTGGIEALGGAGGVNVAFTTVTTTGDSTIGVTAVSAEGDVTVSGGSVTVSGDDSVAIAAVSDEGNVSVTTTGTVSATGAGGIGIYAISAEGDASVTANNVTTVASDAADADSSGSAIIAVGANATVSATGTVTTAGLEDAIIVTATDGNASGTVGTVTVSGDGSRALVVTATEDASATINGAVRATGADADAVFVDGGDNAFVTVGTGGSVLASDGNSITLTSVNGSTLTNAGTIANNAGGIAVLALGGPITINNSGSLTSDIVLTSGADRVNNTGTFVVGTNPNFGGGADVFANSGTVLVGSGATAVVNPVFTGLETFNNTGGLVDLRNGRAGDTLTLPGTFAGSGNSRLGLDVNLGATSTGDRLIIGGAASGQTQVILGQAAGSQAVFNPGLILVQAGAASNADAFDLAGGSIEQGFVRSEIIYNPSDFTFRLAGAPSDSAFRTLNYVEGARNLWLKSADVVSGQLRAQRDALWAYGGGEASPRLWLQIHGSVETRLGNRDFGALGQSRVTNTGFEQDYFGGQVGFDLGGGSGERGGFAVGVTGGYISSSLNFSGSPDRVMFDAVNAGVYASYTSGNFFLNAIGKYDYYWADAKSPSAGFAQSFDGDAYGARGEVGFRFGSDSFFVEPAASISYVKADFEDFAVLGTSVDFDSDDGLRGRAGARIGGQADLFGSKASFYLGANYVREFEGEDGVTFANNGQVLSYVNNRPEEYGEGILGVSVGQANGISGFIEGSYIRSFDEDDFGGLEIEGAGGRAGIRIRF